MKTYAFEAAVISVSIGAVLSVLLPSSLLSGIDDRLIPPKVTVWLRAADVWLAAVFGLAVLILFAVALDAIATEHPLIPRDRRVCLHLLSLAAVYPAFTALAKRTLPILFTHKGADGTSPRFQIALLFLPILALMSSACLLPTLLDPRRSLSTNLLLIAALGVVVVGPCVLVPAVEPWLRRRRLRLVRQRARARRLVEQTVTAVVPHSDGEELSMRVFFDASCDWIDRGEAARVVGRVNDAVYRARREGVDTTQTDRWWVHAWPNRRLSVRHGQGRRLPRHAWPCHDDFFDATALLQSLAARMPLSA